MKRTISGFTIVELLIVIVVIAILSSISVVAYRGMQQRAQNTLTITAAQQTIKLLEAYKSVNGVYPSGYWMTCAGEYDDDVCMYFNGGSDVEAGENAQFKAAIATVGSMPQPSKEKFTLSDGRRGGGVLYWAGASPKRIRYYLKGLNQECAAGGDASNSTSATVCTYTLVD